MKGANSPKVEGLAFLEITVDKLAYKAMCGDIICCQFALKLLILSLAGRISSKETIKTLSIALEISFIEL